MRPLQVLIFLLGVFLLLAGMMFLFPKDGISISENNRLQFPTLTEFFLPDTTVNRTVQLILADTIIDAEPDTSHLAQRRDSLRKEQLKIHLGKGEHPLDKFFTSLNETRSGKQCRIIHFGDSQIEGDRITGPVRNILQKEFGAGGPGLFPVVPVAPVLFMNIDYEGNWKRYAGFGMTDSVVTHKNFGAMVSFSRYAPPQRDSLHPDSTVYRAAVLLSPSRGYAGTKVFSQLKIHWGNTRSPVEVMVESDGNMSGPFHLKPGVSYDVLTVDVTDNAKSIKVMFTGKDSPDLYAFSLERNSGVIMDNVPFRGGSGTELSKVTRSHLSAMLRELSPDLIIMEFGGNVLPYIDDKEEVAGYGRWFQSQIGMIKGILPNVSVLVIGPADMSVKEKTLYVTHPHLEDVRDALKNAAFNTGSAFWDMYGAMGGKNSMPVWVKSEPPMAANDYIHFSPKGAAHIAKLFGRSLMNEYNNWKEHGEEEVP